MLIIGCEGLIAQHSWHAWQLRFCISQCKIHRSCHYYNKCKNIYQFKTHCKDDV